MLPGRDVLLESGECPPRAVELLFGEAGRLLNVGIRLPLTRRLERDRQAFSRTSPGSRGSS
jgi:hypothetical protein